MDNENEDKSLTRLKNNIELSDTLIDNETMVSAYEELEQEVKAHRRRNPRDNMDSNRLSAKEHGYGDAFSNESGKA